MSCCAKCKESGGSCKDKNTVGAFKITPTQGGRGRGIVLPPIPPPSYLPVGQQLSEGQKLVSQNGQYEAVMQTDGNFVVYDLNYHTGYNVLFATNTNNDYGPNRLVMQQDGNLVMYDVYGASIWYTGTNGKGGRYLVMQNDGNLVLYAANQQALWASFQHPNNSPLAGVGAPPLSASESVLTSQTTDYTPYVVTAVAAFALGILGATLIERH